MIGPMEPYNSIGAAEADAAFTTVALRPLSGYLGGELRGGPLVHLLEDEWAERFGVKHAIACNSATSGLLAAAHAIGLGPDDRFICSPFTMSATAAAPALTGAWPLFLDVNRSTFCLDHIGNEGMYGVKAVFLTHLFGLAVNEAWWKGWCDRHGYKLIVDAAQAPFARDGGHLAGTLAHIGVYSLNVHKHIQCGEGGIVVTNDDSLADAVRRFINHGEMAGGRLGLNLRMTEVTAAIARMQLKRADELIGGRVEQAEAIIDAIGELPGLLPRRVPIGCRHVYYTIPFTIVSGRTAFVAALAAEGVPLVEGYVDPLYRLPAFEGCGMICPTAENLHNHMLFYFPNCQYSPTKTQIRAIGEAFKRTADANSRAYDRA